MQLRFSFLCALFFVAVPATAANPAWQSAIEAWYQDPATPLHWLAAGRPTPTAHKVLQEVVDAAARGLNPDDYRGAVLRAQLTDPKLAGDPAQQRTLDRQLSMTVAHLVSDLHAGRVAPRELGHDLDVPHATLDLRMAVAALAGARDPRSVLDDFEPGFHHYDLLKAALQRYRELARDPSLTQLPTLPTRTLRPGDAYAGAGALRRLLRALGDLPPPATGAAPEADLFDAALSAALAHFQDRHGVSNDGALGPATFRLLTTPVERRVRQIEYSLERARWLPPQLSAPPVLVNIPQFRLFAFSTTEDREDSLLQMRVVVGKAFPRNNTPVFAADMRYVVFRPYWDVPRSILLGELWPRISRNPGWIDANGFEIVAGAGDDGRVLPATPENIAALQAGSLRLRQKPGGNNALGVAKFMFPNRFNVYLHGTTAQGLFAEPRRAFSHGCIRLEDPLQFAQFILRNEPGWDRAAIDAAAKGTSPRRINLTTPVRVFILYATAMATEAGNVLFFEDIYGHDARLARALAGHASR